MIEETLEIRFIDKDDVLKIAEVTEGYVQEKYKEAITQAVTQAVEQEREKVEGLRKEENEIVIDICEPSDLYNQAIDDVLEILSQPKKEQEDN